MPKISIVMVDGSFREYFHAIDYFADQTLPPSDYEILWVEYYTDVVPEIREKQTKYPNFRVITLGRTGEYHSSYCFNQGINEAQGDLIIIPDADVVAEPHFLQTIWDEHQTNDKLVLYVHRANEPANAHQDDWTLDYLRQICQITNLANYGSCLTIRKKWLLEINGYDQHPFFGGHLHGNGYDMHARLKTLGLHIMWHPTLRLYHPWHPFTSAPSLGYDIQHTISDFNAQRMIYTAYKGIDATRNHQPPKELTTITKTMRLQHEKEMKHQRRLLNRIIRRIRHRLGK